VEAGESVDILLIDSNPYEAELTSRVLGRYVSNPVRVVTDGPQALAVLYGGNGRSASAGRAPQLIVVDAHVRKADLLDLVERFRTDPGTGHVPVIVLTSSQAESQSIRQKTRHRCACVVKPLDLTKLADALIETRVHWVLLTFGAAAAGAGQVALAV
jgi:two-component system response regulator